MRLRKSIVLVHYGAGKEVDLPLILPLLRVAYREGLGKAANFPPGYEEQLRDSLLGQEHLRLTLATVRARAVGLAISFIHPEPAVGGRLIELQDLVVLPSWRGRGIGSRLLEDLEETASREGCKKIILSVTVDNAVAQRLCRQLGYVHCTPPRYFMEKPLGVQAGS